MLCASALDDFSEWLYLELLVAIRHCLELWLCRFKGHDKLLCPFTYEYIFFIGTTIPLYVLDFFCFLYKQDYLGARTEELLCFIGIIVHGDTIVCSPSSKRKGSFSHVCRRKLFGGKNGLTSCVLFVYIFRPMQVL